MRGWGRKYAMVYFIICYRQKILMDSSNEGRRHRRIYEKVIQEKRRLSTDVLIINSNYVSHCNTRYCITPYTELHGDHYNCKLCVCYCGRMINLRHPLLQEILCRFEQMEIFYFQMYKYVAVIMEVRVFLRHPT